MVRSYATDLHVAISLRRDEPSGLTLRQQAGIPVHTLTRLCTAFTEISISGGPTGQQGQFLAYIHEYVKANNRGVAPTHAEFQRFFNLTAPSVNSMLKRLDEKGYIRRIPGKTRAIELTIDLELIPLLDRPFRL